MMERRSVGAWFRRGGVALGVAAVAFVVVVKLRYGGGSAYADVALGSPRVDEAHVTAVGDLEFPPGNVAGSRDGRVFFNLHPLAQAWRFTDSFLFEIVDGQPRVYPSAAAQADLRFVFGMTVDRQNRLWLTAPAMLDRDRTRLIAYDLTTNTRVVDHELAPGVARLGQDLRVSPDGQTVFLANPGMLRLSPATLTVLDVATWRARDVLGDCPAIQAQNWLMNIAGRPYRLAYGLVSFQGGLDGLAITPDGVWMVLAGMSNDGVYRVPLESLLDRTMSSSALCSRVERVGSKPLSDGIDVSADGRALITDVEHGGIASVDPNGVTRPLVRLNAVSWADGVYSAPDGDVYFTDSGLPLYIEQFLGPPRLDRLRAGRPYHLYRFHLPPTSVATSH